MEFGQTLDTFYSSPVTVPSLIALREDLNIFCQLGHELSNPGGIKSHPSFSLLPSATWLDQIENELK